MNLDLPTPEEHVVDAEDARVRLLLCYVCNTIEPLPWFDGPNEYDETLKARLAKHRTPEGHPHVGNLATVSETSWNTPERREKIVEELSAVRNGGEAGLGTKFYDVRNTFEEDAMTCWRVKHGRTENCDDYKSDKMRLLPDTRGDRKELGMATRAVDRPGGTYLCMFCPYHSVVMQRARKKAGIY
jgi:hypothetical protein